MTVFSFLPFAAAIFSLFLAVASLLARKRSIAMWCFCGGMAVLATDSFFAGLCLRATQLEDVVYWLTLRLLVESFLPVAWLSFSLTYSRGDYRDSLARWTLPLAIAGLLPIALSLGVWGDLLQPILADLSGNVVQLRYGPIAIALNVIFLVALVLIVANLEQTFRSAVGTMRWQIKFVVLGLAVIFGAHLYVRTHVVLFSAYDLAWSGIESSALLIGCAFLALAYVRSGYAEIDVHPSRAVLRSSLTILILGVYLFVVGVLGQLVRRFGGAEGLQFQIFVVLVGMAGLAVLLLSDRLRQRIHHFVARHFAGAQHDSVRIWTEFSRRLADVKDQAALCAASARLISETFEVLSVTIWLLDEQKAELIVAASTAAHPHVTDDSAAANSSAVTVGARAMPTPFDLEDVNEPWAEELRRLNSRSFPNGGDRWCVPLRAGEQFLGLLVLVDRVNGAGYTLEELELLQCIADQMTSVLLKLRLANELARARELDAFRAMSAFFVHDLKNAAASLNLMLRNAPVHFDDPEFRQDALRGIGHTAQRIEQLIARLTALRQRPGFRPVETNLNQVLIDALDKLNGMPQVQLTKDFQPLPIMLVDREQIQSVVTNLVLNARDAVGDDGRILVRTEHLGDNVILSVTDNGCGMSAAFMKDSLFRPFQSTKKQGLGIGMFQTRMIVERHGGSIRVESETGKGTTFRVSLPVKA